MLPEIIASLNGEKRSWKYYDGTRNGSAATYESNRCDNKCLQALSSTSLIVAYHDQANNDLDVCILTLSGTSISAGTPALIDGNEPDDVSVAVLSSTAAVVCYRDMGTGEAEAAFISISGTTPTPAVPVSVNAGSADTSVCALSSTKAVVVYNDGAGGSRVLSIAGAVITVEAETVFEADAASDCSVCALSSSVAVVTYKDGGDTYGKAAVLSVSGTAITAGTPATFESGAITYTSVCKLSSDKALVCYCDASGYGKACVLSVSGTSISPGTAITFESATSHFGCDKALAAVSETIAVICYPDGGNSSRGTACVLLVNGATVTSRTPVVFESDGAYLYSSCSPEESKVVTTYRDSGSSNYGRAICLMR